MYFRPHRNVEARSRACVQWRLPQILLRCFPWNNNVQPFTWEQHWWCLLIYGRVVTVVFSTKPNLPATDQWVVYVSLSFIPGNGHQRTRSSGTSLTSSDRRYFYNFIFALVVKDGALMFCWTSETILILLIFLGNLCQTFDSCSSSPCLNGGRCLRDDVTNGYSCQCPPTHTGEDCGRLNYCSSGPCLNGGSCSLAGDSYTCRLLCFFSSKKFC